MKDQPLVSCIMPTFNRRAFVPRAIAYFQRQAYPHRELIIVDDGADAVGDLVPRDSRIRYVRLQRKRTTGAKRNLACGKAKGEIIANWDDDDWIAPWRLGYQVEQLTTHGADVCGLDRLYFFEPKSGKAWQYVYPNGNRPWLAGGTMCYTTAFWRRNPYPDANVGEDTRFVWSRTAKRVRALEKNYFYVAMIHPGNSSSRITSGSRWRSFSVDKVHKIIGVDLKYYKKTQQVRRNHSAGQHPVKVTDIGALSRTPLVSCILPTYNRKHFLLQAIAYFKRQNYPNRELVIVDDGTEPVDDVVAEDHRINYIRLPKRHSIGAKRNMACSAARGEIVIFWDDDDWYANGRIAYQVEPLIKKRAKVTGLGKGLMLCTKTHTFWTTSDHLHKRMFFQGIISGTMAFWKRFWDEGARFPNVSMADDVSFLKILVRRGVRLKKLDNSNMFIYVRHNANTWKFSTGNFLDRQGWKVVEPPAFMSSEDLGFYNIPGRTARPKPETSKRSRIKEPKPSKDKPLVSCILCTCRRRPFLKQAVKYFLRQTYQNKELLIVDDGADSCEALLPKDEGIRHLRLDGFTPLGTKLNIGIGASKGTIVQKLDDDDYYHPDFLKTTVSALLGHDPLYSVAGFDSFLVLIGATGELKFSGTGWCAGGTLCFYRKLWEKRPFRDVPKAVDWWFLKDHSPQRIKIQNPELYILLRHDAGHLWTDMGRLDVTNYFQGRPNYHKSLKDIIYEEDLSFYKGLYQMDKKAQNDGLPTHNGGRKMTVLKTIKGPDAEGRNAMYYPDQQDFAYQKGAYNYLGSIAMLPRIGAIAAYIKALGLKKILDVGSGTCELLNHLDADVSYTGIDISSTAMTIAKRRFADRSNSVFHTLDFRQWEGPAEDFDGVVWAGISCTWTRKGKGGNLEDWCDILDLAERPLKDGGYLIFELVTAHWPTLQRIIDGRYEYEAGCDLDCFQSEESPNRSIRIFKKKALIAP
jgi:glycosyltransferase involved in cell wall biosynthesis